MIDRDLSEQMLDQTARKKVLREITYGLYVVTAHHDGERGGFTANWVSQVSFDPPLVMVSVERDSSTLSLIQTSKRFTLCTLSADQRQVAADFGRPKARAGDKFESGYRTVTNSTGDVILVDALGYMVCAVESETEAGDSIAIIGEVVEIASLREGDPLTMRGAGFRHAG